MNQFELKRVLLIGATGAFGRRLALGLAKVPQVSLVLASRSPSISASAPQLFAQLREAEAAPASTTSTPPPPSRISTVALDRLHAAQLESVLSKVKPHLVIDAAGPFQGADLRCAKACIEAGAHWIDIADAADYVTAFPAELDALAKRKGVLAVCGASTTPAVSDCVVRELTSAAAAAPAAAPAPAAAAPAAPAAPPTTGAPPFSASAAGNGWKRIDSIDTVILPAGTADVGESVLKAITSYAGTPVTSFEEGRTSLEFRRGWDEPSFKFFPRFAMSGGTSRGASSSASELMQAGWLPRWLRLRGGPTAGGGWGAYRFVAPVDTPDPHLLPRAHRVWSRVTLQAGLESWTEQLGMAFLARTRAAADKVLLPPLHVQRPRACPFSSLGNFGAWVAKLAAAAVVRAKAKKASCRSGSGSGSGGGGGGGGTESCSAAAAPAAAATAAAPAAGVAVGGGELLLPSAQTLLAARRWTRFFCGATGGMVVEVAGVDSGGAHRREQWTLLAHEGHGPNVPILPALALAKKLLLLSPAAAADSSASSSLSAPASASSGSASSSSSSSSSASSSSPPSATAVASSSSLPEPGAFACVGKSLLSLADIEREIKFLNLNMTTHRDTLLCAKHSLWEAVPGFDKMPATIQYFHSGAVAPVWRGRAVVRGSSSVLARLFRAVVGLPSPPRPPAAAAAAADGASGAGRGAGDAASADPSSSSSSSSFSSADASVPVSVTVDRHAGNEETWTRNFNRGEYVFSSRLASSLSSSSSSSSPSFSSPVGRGEDSSSSSSSHNSNNNQVTITETFGIFRFTLGVECTERGLSLPVRAWSLDLGLGPQFYIPMPLSLAPRSESFEYMDEYPLPVAGSSTSSTGGSSSGNRSGDGSRSSRGSRKLFTFDVKLTHPWIRSEGGLLAHYKGYLEPVRPDHLK